MLFQSFKQRNIKKLEIAGFGIKTIGLKDVWQVEQVKLVIDSIHKKLLSDWQKGCKVGHTVQRALEFLNLWQQVFFIKTLLVPRNFTLRGLLNGDPEVRIRIIELHIVSADLGNVLKQSLFIVDLMIQLYLDSCRDIHSFVEKSFFLFFK